MPANTCGPLAPFDRRHLRARRDRAAPRWRDHNFLVREAAERLLDRLDDVTRGFPAALDLGCHGGEVAALVKGRGGVETLVEADLSTAMVRLARESAPSAGLSIRWLVADEEQLPFADDSFDLVLSCLSLHWVNDLPGTLAWINRILKPDGLFLASLFGGGTLGELRAAWVEAETATEGGASPIISPFIDIRDAGSLLQRAGFALPVVDNDTITVRYAAALDLMRELRGMGEGNALRKRRKHFTRRNTLARAASAYREMFADSEGRMPATFQIITMTAWAPHESQPKPLPPGSAQARLAEALDGEEEPVGEQVGGADARETDPKENP